MLTCEPVCGYSIPMQVKLWPEVEKGLKKMVSQPEHKKLKLSVAKIANFALAQYIELKKPKC